MSGLQMLLWRKLQRALQQQLQCRDLCPCRQQRQRQQKGQQWQHPQVTNLPPGCIKLDKPEPAIAVALRESVFTQVLQQRARKKQAQATGDGGFADGCKTAHSSLQTCKAGCMQHSSAACTGTGWGARHAHHTELEEGHTCTRASLS